MKVAVIGGGIFGCTSAIRLATDGHEVHLFERLSDIMMGASGANQFRLHEGYHYPRSPETVTECQSGLISFRDQHADCIVKGGVRKYIIADGSRTGSGQFEQFMTARKLHYKKLGPGEYRVWETSLDIIAFRNKLMRELDRVGVAVHTSELCMAEQAERYDHVVVAGYAANAEILQSLGIDPPEYQYEVVEKPLLSVPDMGRLDSVVVMDGPFCSVDPYSTGGVHVMGHVNYAIWHTSYGVLPDVPNEIMPMIYAGLVYDPFPTRWPLMQADGQRFIPELKDATHIGSFFTLRAVLQDKDATDERPTVVRRHSDQVTEVFSGKIPTCVDAADQVSAILGVPASHVQVVESPGDLRAVLTNKLH